MLLGPNPHARCDRFACNLLLGLAEVIRLSTMELVTSKIDLQALEAFGVPQVVQNHLEDT
ncbi:hypothetical protein BFJ71_g15238 [Fusarium oxysporum]|nr:hypothetical protein BFJ71_g15238 [Fusarium oxysporum]